MGFRNAHVFDVQQTEGAELPAMREISGTVGENRDRILAFINAQGIELVFTEKIAPGLGIGYCGRATILPVPSRTEEFSPAINTRRVALRDVYKRQVGLSRATRRRTSWSSTKAFSGYSNNARTAAGLVSCPRCGTRWA